MRRTIGVVTVARSDYGIYLPVLRRIQADPELRLVLYVTGMHLSPEFGNTVRAVAADGFEIVDRIEMLLSTDSPEGVSKSMGLGIVGFAQSYSRFRPDILVALGDRFEMFTAVVAALPFRIPVAHIHGGESTEGAIDEAIRHSITKMSHLHFPSTQAYADRIVRMGEAPWRITVSGAPGLDNLRGFQPCTVEEMRTRFGLDLSHRPLLVTFHPVTLEFEDTAHHIDGLLWALERSGLPTVFTYPNADTSGRLIIERIEAFVRKHPAKAQVAQNLGTQGYFSLMSHALAMVGNSSSGIIEAASFKLPVVNIGNRQRGRIHGCNVADVPCERDEILGAIRRLATPEFRASLADSVNPYGLGNASDLIAARLKSVPLDATLLMKAFHDA